MKTQKFYGIKFHFENFNHSLDADFLGEILFTRFLSSCGLSLKRRQLSDFFKESFPFIENIVLYRVQGRKSYSEREFSTSEYIISKKF